MQNASSHPEPCRCCEDAARIADISFGLIADALHVSEEVLGAITTGEIACLVGFEWPTGGNVTIKSAADLDEWRQCQRDVDRFGRDAVADAEERDRRERRQEYLAANPPPERVPVPPKPTTYTLYRLFGEANRLLYVGITRNLPGRLKTHTKKWGDVIVRTEAVEYPNHAEVLAAEAAEIAEKCPPFNAAGVGA